MSAAQVGPLDIGAQVFAPHGAAGRPFNARAILGRHAAARLPHGDQALADPEKTREAGLTADVIDGALEG